MPTHEAPSEPVSAAAGWGSFQPGAAISSLSELHAGDLVLERTRKPGFARPLLHVVQILGGDPSGGNRPLVRARFVDPRDPTRAREGMPAWIVLWDFLVAEGRTELFRIEQTQG